jgi:hypothetical protein
MPEDRCMSIWLHDSIGDARETFATLDEEGSDNHVLRVVDLKAMKEISVKKSYAFEV